MNKYFHLNFEWIAYIDTHSNALITDIVTLLFLLSCSGPLSHSLKNFAIQEVNNFPLQIVLLVDTWLFVNVTYAGVSECVCVRLCLQFFVSLLSICEQINSVRWRCVNKWDIERESEQTLASGKIENANVNVAASMKFLWDVKHDICVRAEASSDPLYFFLLLSLTRVFIWIKFYFRTRSGKNDKKTKISIKKGFYFWIEFAKVASILSYFQNFNGLC